jgi:hypothetical protein
MADNMSEFYQLYSVNNLSERLIVNMNYEIHNSEQGGCKL